ncbi:MAG TPA: nucleotidyltransferase family protein [Deltaproteobacteria bacterium]|nr:nucleotidyltransferase family protein [Deltaproteobacteria bacterium]
MKAMILAAGEGTRLRPLTERIPKPMLSVSGLPILEYNIRLLTKHGIRELVINLHHCPDVVSGYFGDGNSWSVSITYSYEPVLLGTAGAVKKVESLFDSTFLVVYGDNLITCDIGRLCAFHRKKGGIGTLTLFYRKDPTSSGIVDLDQDDRIIRFLEKPELHQVFSHWVNAGILVLEPEVLKYIRSDKPSDFGRDILPALIADGQPLYGYKMSEKLWWIDTLEDYKRLQELVERGEVELP